MAAPKDSQTQFIEAVRPAATKAALELGVSPDILIAQAAQETGWGTQARNNNLFNIKGAGGAQLNALEYDAQGKPYNEPSTFKAYGSIEESFADYANFLKANPRYTNALKAGDDATFAKELQNAGYATDPNYAANLLAVQDSVNRRSPAPSLSDAKAEAINGASQRVQETLANTTNAKRIAMGGQYSSPYQPIDELIPSGTEAGAPIPKVPQELENRGFTQAMVAAKAFLQDTVSDEAITEAFRPVADFFGKTVGDAAIKSQGAIPELAVNAAQAIAGGVESAAGSIFNAAARQINELQKDSEAVTALQEEQKLSAEIIALQEGKTGNPLMDAVASAKISKLQDRKGELDKVLGEFTMGDAAVYDRSTKRESAQKYLDRREWANTVSENTETINNFRDKTDSLKLSGDVSKTINEFADDYEKEGLTAVNTIGLVSDVMSDAVANPRGVITFVAEQVPNLFLGKFGNASNLMDKAYDDASKAFQKDYGREPTDQETAAMQGYSLAAAAVGVFGDEATKGALSKTLGKVSSFLPDGFISKMVTKTLGLPSRIVGNAFMEAAAEGSENILTQLAGKQEGERTLENVDLRAAGTEAALGGLGGGAINAPIEIAKNPIVKGTAKAAAFVVKKTPAAVVGTAKVAAKVAVGAAKIPANIKALNEKRKLKAEAVDTPNTEEAVTEAVAEATATPTVDATPTVEEVKNTATDLSELADTVQVEDAESPAVQELVQAVKDTGEQFTAFQQGTDFDGQDIMALMNITMGVGKEVDALAAQAQALAETDLTDGDRAVVDAITARVNAGTGATVVGSMAALAKANPLVGLGVEATFEALTSPTAEGTQADLDNLEVFLTETVPADKQAETRQGMIDSLLQTTLYSGNVLNNSAEQLRKAASLSSSPQVTEQYEALADIKTAADVSNEILEGTGTKFKGVKTHINELRDAIAKEDKGAVGKTTAALTNFFGQRQRKVDALNASIATVEQSGNAEEARYGDAPSDKFIVHPSKHGLAQAKKLAATVASEANLVGYGLHAANRLQGKTSTAEVMAASSAYHVKAEVTAQPPPEPQPETVDSVIAQPTPEVVPEVVASITSDGTVVTEEVPDTEVTLDESGVSTLIDTYDEPQLEGESADTFARRTANRFKQFTTKVANSPLWATDNVLDQLTRFDATAGLVDLHALLETHGFDISKVNDNDLAMVKGLRDKKVWFNDKMKLIAERVVTQQAAKEGSQYKESNALRNLLDADGNFPPKVVAAAFMAYTNAVQSVGESFYTDDNALTTMLGFSDASELNALPHIAQLRTLGTAVTPETFGKAFKRALGLKLAKGAPLSIQDSVNSAMGYSLNSILQTDREFFFREEQVEPDTRKGKVVRGYTLRTEANTPRYVEITGSPVPHRSKEAFFQHMTKAGNAVALGTSPENTAPKNYIDELPPEVDDNETHIRSSDKLTAAQVKAENAYRKVAWVPDTLLSSFSKALGLEGFKHLNGYAEQAELDNMNVNERRSVDGTNMKLVDQYEKMTNMLDQMGADSKVYFTSAFSLVRRQQMRGEVNPQGDKWHRVVLGVQNSPTVAKMNLTKLAATGDKGDSYYFMLALGQALGLDADKQANGTTYQETADIIATELDDHTSLANQLSNHMKPNGEFTGELPVELLDLFKEEAAGNFHKQQGILTLAKLLRQADANGNVTDFKHYLRFEVDGLTNGPFHSTFLTGLGSMSAGEAEAYMQRGGFMTSAAAEDTHAQIGNKKFKDFYLTSAAVGQEALDGIMAKLEEKSAVGNTPAKLQLQGIKFIAGKAKILGYDASTGEITIKRAGTKNPVTVTVYGGGSGGIHKSMASEIADIFYSDMSKYIDRLNASGTPAMRSDLRKELIAELDGWAATMYVRGKKFGPLMDVKKATTVKALKEALVKATLSKDEFGSLTTGLKRGIGGAITSGIDEVFSGNKHTAALMNASLNFITVIANDTFSRAYKALHAKRVAADVINGTDSLSREDTALIQTSIEAALPFVKTSVQHSEVNIAKEGRDAVAGLQRVKAPSLTNPATTTQSQVAHTTTGFSSPGVRGIPVLTISVDANTQVLNHQLQAGTGKYMNVLDAIDHAADSTVREANELFNVAEYMSLVTSDPLARVQETVTQSLDFQSKPLTVDGIVIDPLLKLVNTESADIGLEQEQLRSALNELSLPIHKGLPSFGDSGDLAAALKYVLAQLDIERNNAAVGRDNFLFGNETLLMNQMAGIDGGGVKIAGGQVQLTEEARVLAGAKGEAMIDTFNAKMAERKTAWATKPKAAEVPTDVENMRQLAAEGDAAAQADIAHEFDTLSGIWQGLRAVGRFDSNTVSYDMGMLQNRTKFKDMLFGRKDIVEEGDASQFVLDGFIPNNGILFTAKVNQKGIDTALKNLTVLLTDNLPSGTNGSMAIVDGKYVISVRNGISTAEATDVLQHEVTHALVAHGLATGVKHYVGKRQSLERTLVAEQLQQIGRFLKTNATGSAVDTLHKYATAYKKDRSPQNLYTLLQEHMALVAANGLHAEFEKHTVATKDLSRPFRDYITGALKATANYLTKAFGRFSAKAQPVTSEKDVFANLLSGYATSQGTLANQAALYSSAPEATVSKFKQAENLTDNAIRSISGKGIAGMFRLLRKADPSLRLGVTGEGISNATRAEAWAEFKNDFLAGGQDGEKMSFIREFMSEFMLRDKASSKVVDSINNRKTTTVDAARENTKDVVIRQLEKAFGGLVEDDHKALTNGVLRSDMGALVNNGTSLATVAQYLREPTALATAINGQLTHIRNNLGLSKRQSNLMLNEARALGKRSIIGGAFEGFNLPNAKAIANLHGTGVEGTTDPLVETAIDELASLYSLSTIETADSLRLARMIKEQLASGLANNGFTHIIRKHAAIKNKMVKQHGEGLLNGLPKGYLPELHEAGRAVKVVPAGDLDKYQGWTKVRVFNYEHNDPTKAKSFLMSNTEGSTASFVQGAMSTIETSIGGFVQGTGFATDKSLPSHGAGNRQRGIQQEKAKLASQLGSNVYDLKPRVDGMIPNINGLGQVVGYRYVLSNAEKTELVGMDLDAGLLLGTQDARVAEEGFAEEFNGELATALGTAYRERDVTKEGQFVKVYAGSGDAQMANIWRIMPQHLKSALTKEFGGNFAYVHKRDLTNALGYREWSMSELWNGSINNPKVELMTGMFEVLLGQDAAKKIRWAERQLQRGVTELKDIIVIKSIVVPAANLASNVNQLHLRGIAAEDILKDAKVGGFALKEYKDLNAELSRVRNAKDTQSPSEQQALNFREREITAKIEANPVIALVREGLLPTVVDDLTHRTEDGLLSVLTDKLPTYGDNTLTDIGQNIVITPDSLTYRMLNESLEYGDFVAKYVLYQHMLREGKSHQEAIDSASVEFINYSTLSPRALDYLNKTGAISFFKYFTRIQPIIFNTIVKNPTRALLTFTGADTIGLPSIFDALWVTKDMGYTTGLYDLMGMAGGAHPVFGGGL